MNINTENIDKDNYSELNSKYSELNSKYSELNSKYSELNSKYIELILDIIDSEFNRLSLKEDITDMYDKSYNYLLLDLNNITSKILNDYRARSDDIDNNVLYKLINDIGCNLIKEKYKPDIDNQIDVINNIPFIEQRTPDWYQIRNTMVTASEAGNLLNSNNGSNIINTLRKKLDLDSSSPFSGSSAIKHGVTYEDVTKLIYESRYNVYVKEYGIIKSTTHNVGASPDGLVIKCDINDYDSLSKYGRLVEIKNPYSRVINDKISPLYLIQIFQQEFSMRIPVCDFVETTIVDTECNKYAIPPYKNLNEMLNDTLDTSDNSWKSLVQNKNIPYQNLSSKGMEKGVCIAFEKKISDSESVKETKIYPINKIYQKKEILEWIRNQKKEMISKGYNNYIVKIWRLDIISIKTKVFDQNLYQNQYLTKLDKYWKIISKIKNSDKYDSSKFIKYCQIKLDNKQEHHIFNILDNDSELIDFLNNNDDSNEESNVIPKKRTKYYDIDINML